jgi:tetratricopeptide (TPR) repeat protein
MVFGGSNGTIFMSLPLLLCSLMVQIIGAQPETNLVKRAYQQYSQSFAVYSAEFNNTTSAWKFAKSCFELAEITEDNSQREKVANEGIAAATRCIRLAPQDPAGHFYLGLNRGQLARTKLLGALTLVKEMEEALLASLQVDETFHLAAAHRSLGMLYVQAPGWPASVGSRTKARKHLERAIELAPDYPDNHLSAIEAYLSWKDKDKVAVAIPRYQRILTAARDKYKGPEWQQPWRDWDVRWKDIQTSYEKLTAQPAH